MSMQAWAAGRGDAAGWHGSGAVVWRCVKHFVQITSLSAAWPHSPGNVQGLLRSWPAASLFLYSRG